MTEQGFCILHAFTRLIIDNIIHYLTKFFKSYAASSVRKSSLFPFLKVRKVDKVDRPNAGETELIKSDFLMDQGITDCMYS
jgi:hypothetical protein